jgi:hypothetical protein
MGGASQVSYCFFVIDWRRAFAKNRASLSTNMPSVVLMLDTESLSSKTQGMKLDLILLGLSANYRACIRTYTR